MTTIKPIRLRFCATALAALFLAGCTGLRQTLNYRSIQDQFEVAAQSDNNLTRTAYSESSVFTQSEYEFVIEQLTQEYISELDPKLQANAWMLKAVSQWRTGSLNDAVASTSAGVAANPITHSRDDILLTLLPALIADSENSKAWVDSGRTFSLENYQKIESAYIGALDDVKLALAKIGPQTPPSISHYIHYQRWRILRNWWQVLVSLPEPEEGDASNPIKSATQYLGTETNPVLPLDAADEARNQIPNDHPLAKIIDAH